MKKIGVLLITGLFVLLLLSLLKYELELSNNSDLSITQPESSSSPTLVKIQTKLSNKTEPSAPTELYMRNPTSPSPLSSTQKEPEQPLLTKPIFGVEVVYAYVGKSLHEESHDHFDGVPVYPKTKYQSAIYCKFTHIPNPEAEFFDAILEVYLIEVTSDTGCKEKYKYFGGTDYHGYFQDLMGITQRTNALIDSSKVSVERGFFTSNWTINKSMIKLRIGTIGVYESGSSEMGLWSAGEPNTITVSIHRLGWTAARENSTFLFREELSEPIVEIQLEKYGNGFLHNTIIPQSQLSQTDLFNPDL